LSALKTAYLWRFFVRKSAKYGAFNGGKSVDFQGSGFGIPSAFLAHITQHFFGIISA
jgi:hypothetical protein